MEIQKELKDETSDKSYETLFCLNILNLVF